MPNHWILKSEPETFHWETLVTSGWTHWDGVRNHQAKRHLMSMAVGDLALFYHSVSDKALVGIATITKPYYPDPTDDTGKWVAVEVQPIRPLARPITLAQIKADPVLQSIALVRQGRLSVVPLTEAEYHHLLTYETVRED